jgi:hypothetical protein
MPPLEQMDRHQKVLLWEASGESDDYGEPFVADEPEEIEVRLVWSDQGDSQAATLITDREIPVDSRVWEGGYDDLPGTAAIPESDWMIVTDSAPTKDIKGRNVRYEHKLAWYKDEPDPTE